MKPQGERCQRLCCRSHWTCGDTSSKQEINLPPFLISLQQHNTSIPSLYMYVQLFTIGHSIVHSPIFHHAAATLYIRGLHLDVGFDSEGPIQFISKKMPIINLIHHCYMCTVHQGNPAIAQSTKLQSSQEEWCNCCQCAYIYMYIPYFRKQNIKSFKNKEIFTSQP
jgi:hypothetical protein